MSDSEKSFSLEELTKWANRTALDPIFCTDFWKKEFQMLKQKGFKIPSEKPPVREKPEKMGDVVVRFHDLGVKKKKIANAQLYLFILMVLVLLVGTACI